MSDPSRPSEPLPQRISRVLAWLAGATILVGCGFTIAIDVFARMILNRTVVESFEISGYAFAVGIGLGLPYTVTTKANIRVDILQERLPRWARTCCHLIAAGALAVAAVTLARFAWGTLEQSWALGARSPSNLAVPLIGPQGIWWFGILWFAIMAILVPLQAALRLLQCRTAEFDALIGTVRIDDEMEQSGVETSATSVKKIMQ